MSPSRQTSRSSMQDKIDGPGCRRSGTQQQFILLKDAILPETAAHRKQQPDSGFARNVGKYICVFEQMSLVRLFVCLLANGRTRSLGIDTTEEMRMGSFPPDTSLAPAQVAVLPELMDGEVYPHAQAKVVSERTDVRAGTLPMVIPEMNNTPHPRPRQ